MTPGARIVAQGFAFPEPPRWHRGCLFLSDMGTGSVHIVDLASSRVTTSVLKVPDAPRGLGWNDTARSWFVSMVRAIM
jgi:hypothetical protein